MTQLGIFDAPLQRLREQPVGRPRPAGASEAAFQAFHAQNPHVYRALVELARAAKERGAAEVGIGMLWEVLRWRLFFETSDGNFKLNNNHRSRYARLIMAQEQDLVGLFETRELASEKAA
jgi:hypothetical protein